MRPGVLLSAALVVLLCTGGAALALDSGPEIQVNETTAGDQLRPAVDADGNGASAVAWMSMQDGFFGGIYARRFDASGSPVTGELPVNTTTADHQDYPDVLVTGDGHTVVWQSNQQDGSGYGVYARRFDPEGSPLSGEIQVNTTTTLQQEHPVVAGGGGRFVVAWQSSSQDGDGDGVYARRFDSAGPLSVEIPVNTTTTSDQLEPAIAADGEGGFTVAWTSDDQDGSGYGIYARRFDSEGLPLSGEIPVNTTTTDEQVAPDLAALAGGGFVVAWQSSSQDGDGDGVYARRFDSAGNPRGGEIRVNATTFDDQAEPAIAADGSGFAVAWADYAQDGSLVGIYARRFDSTGDPLSGEIPVNTTTAGAQYKPAIASGGAPGFTAAWISFGQDGDEGGIFARRFVAPPDEEEPVEPPAPTPLAAPDTIPPVLWGLRLAPRVFALSQRAKARGGARASARGKGRRRARRVRRSTLVRYRLSEPARVRVAVQRGLPGRRKLVRGKRRCVKPTRGLIRAKAKRCLRFRALRPALVRAGAAGQNRFRFAGRLGRRALSPGRYRIVLRATDAAGNSSQLRRRVFRIVRVAAGR